jgi:hypothetical protein
MDSDDITEIGRRSDYNRILVDKIYKSAQKIWHTYFKKGSNYEGTGGKEGRQSYYRYSIELLPVSERNEQAA